MNKVLSAFSLSLVLLFLQGFSQNVFACTPSERGVPSCVYFSRSDAVFIGKVTGIETFAEPGSSGYKFVYFKVIESFKGQSDKTFKLRDDFRTSCESNFKKGETWIVHAIVEKTDGIFTKYIADEYDKEDYKELVTFLKQASQGKNESSISGWLDGVDREMKGKSDGFDIRIEGNGDTVLLKTDKDGKFHSPALTEGIYKIQISLPFYAILSYYYDEIKENSQEKHRTLIEYNVTLKSGECDYKYFEFGKPPQKNAR